MTEKMVAAMVGLIGLFIFNYIVSQIYATLSSKNAARVTFQNLLSSVTLFMEHQNLSLSLQKRVRDYMSLLWSSYQGEAYPGGPYLMHDLPTELQQIVLMKERGQLLSKIPFFEQAGPAFIRDIASVSVMYFFPRGEIIQYSDTITRELFCVHRGICQILTDDLSDIVALYGEGMCFGEVGFMFGKQAVVTVRAKTHCEILSIDFEKMKPVLERYPAMKRQIEMLQNKTDYYNQIVDAVEGMMRSKHRPIEEDVTQIRRKDAAFAYEGRRYAKKSKCYVEDFGNFPIYAGTEEETIEERLLKLSKTRMIPRKPRTYLEHMKEFFFRTFPSFILMRNAILPSNTTYIRWEFFRICVAIAISTFSLLLFSFLHKERWMWIILYNLEGFCWIDIYIRMHVAFYKDNCLQVETLETAKHYLKTSFLLDFISCFPWEIIGLMYFNINTIALWDTRPEILHIFAYLRVPHILQLYRVPLAFSFYQSEITTEKTAVTFLKFFLYTAMFLHFCTCIVFAIVCPPADLTGDPTIYLLPLGKHNCSRLSWVNHLDYSFDVVYENVTFTQLYAISLYYATTTLCGIGYGDIHPYLTSMRIAMIFIMVAGALYIGFLSGTVTSILANADAPRAAFTDKEDIIKLFLKSQKVTGQLYDSILSFYTFRWIRTKGVNQDVVFEYLPSSLLGDVSTIIYADVIAKAFGLKVKRKQRQELVTQHLSPLERKLSGKLGQPFFQEVLKKESVEQLETDAGFIRLLARQIRPCHYRAGDIICKRNEYGAEMYFIDKGEVDVLSIDESSVMITLKAGQHFGEGSLLFSEPRATTIRAGSNCDLFTLSKTSLDEAIIYYPKIYKEIKKAAERKQVELIQNSISSKKKKMGKDKEFSSDDTGYIKFYKDIMEEDHKKNYNKPTYRGCFLLDSFSNFWMHLLKFHNSTMDPVNPIRIIYQYTSCLFIVIFFWSITFMPITFNLSQNLFTMAMVIEYILLIEILFKFHVAYYDEEGTYISGYKSASRNYLFGKMGYFFDIVASFPSGLIVLSLIGTIHAETYFAFIVKIRLLHLPKILSALIFMREEEKSISTNLLVIRIIKYLVQGVLFVHITALICVLYAENTDRFRGDIEASYFVKKYMYGAYWTLATYTTTGFGDFRPRNFGEMLFTIFLMIIAKMHVIYNMGVLSSSQTNKQSLQVAFEEKLQAVTAYMIDTNIPSNLYNRVTHFYNYIWTRTKGIRSEVLFQDIPHCMKTDIFSRICIHLLKKQQLFAHLSETFLHHLVSKMYLISYTAGEHIKTRGDVGVGMWLIIFGSVKLNRYENKGDYYKSVSTGSILGLHLLFTRKLCGFTAVAENYVDVFYLTKDRFDEICSYYPKVTKRLYKRAHNYASIPL
ncbi:uncharacterized protein LOC125310242 isoform X2 [Alosa alosa]|uniref:uncharacterized protein LOC125310242 isoform X2 n=1 Tax=Alosa alosa TaxID=278164 RepID=UPI0020155411|nr:uncharacterized protein LOC125310242 isoform X2 [Alosa alosa]